MCVRYVGYLCVTCSGNIGSCACSHPPYLPIILYRTKTIKTHKKVLKLLNLAYTVVLVQGRISQNIWLSMYLLAVLGSQGIFVKCTATAIFFPYSRLAKTRFTFRYKIELTMKSANEK